MLVLSRMENQAIIIGDDVEIIVTEIRGDKVRLGIEAPNYVSIHRKEVYRDIADGKKIPTRRLLRIYTSRLNQFGANSKQCAELVSDNSDNKEFVELANMARLLKLALTEDAEVERSA